MGLGKWRQNQSPEEVLSTKGGYVYELVKLAKTNPALFERMVRLALGSEERGSNPHLHRFFPYIKAAARRYFGLNENANDMTIEYPEATRMITGPSGQKESLRMVADHIQHFMLFEIPSAQKSMQRWIEKLAKENPEEYQLLFSYFRQFPNTNKAKLEVFAALAPPNLRRYLTGPEAVPLTGDKKDPRFFDALRNLPRETLAREWMAHDVGQPGGHAETKEELIQDSKLR